jgi:glycosyltransferase involved in cell wall biosynthesis
VQESFGVAQSRISVIPNGIDVDAIRAGEPFPTDSLVVLSAGRLESYKNVDLAVRALAHLDDRFVLAVAGDGPARAALEALAANLGLTPRVRFLGRLDSATLNRWYRTARVYVSMSGRECFGITLLEALAAGASVVAADTPVHREVLASVAQANVELVPTGSPAPALADALRSAALRRRATGATRPLSWDDVASRTLDVYSSLLGSPGQASAA